MTLGQIADWFGGNRPWGTVEVAFLAAFAVILVVIFCSEDF